MRATITKLLESAVAKPLVANRCGSPLQWRGDRTYRSNRGRIRTCDLRVMSDKKALQFVQIGRDSSSEVPAFEGVFGQFGTQSGTHEISGTHVVPMRYSSSCNGSAGPPPHPVPAPPRAQGRAVLRGQVPLRRPAGQAPHRTGVADLRPDSSGEWRAASRPGRRTAYFDERRAHVAAAEHGPSALSATWDDV